MLPSQRNGMVKAVEPAVCPAEASDDVEMRGSLIVCFSWPPTIVHVTELYEP